MLRRLVLVLGLVAMVVGCGRGSPETSGQDVDDVKAVVAGLIEANLNDDLAAATPNLDMGGFLAAVGSPLAFEKNMTAEQTKEQMQSCFNQLNVVKSQSKIKSRADADQALQGAVVNVLSQTRSATVNFQAPDATREGAVKFVCRLTQTPGGTWKLIRCEPDFGR